MENGSLSYPEDGETAAILYPLTSPSKSVRAGALTALKPRPAVEGTIVLFKRRTYNGKLRIRGLKRVKNVVILTVLAINFRRVTAVVGELFCFLLNFANKILSKPPEIVIKTMQGAKLVLSAPGSSTSQ